ncbi:MAG: rhodanese-like domain-containing protein [Desulfobacterales bacterium]|jgi:rhodanese-related sulfurtransferase
MLKKSLVLLVGVCVLFALISAASADTAAPKDEKKKTEMGKYMTAAEAYSMWKSSPDKINLVDCRLPQEYVFVGHAPMAYNLPSKLWTGKWDSEKKDYVLEDNPAFETHAKKLFRLDDTILVMCRSGHRSAASVNRLTKVGFTNVYNIIDGFEGDKISDEDSVFNGKRMKNGWKNSFAPWTYDLNPDLVYAP